MMTSLLLPVVFKDNSVGCFKLDANLQLERPNQISADVFVCVLESEVTVVTSEEKQTVLFKPLT